MTKKRADASNKLEKTEFHFHGRQFSHFESSYSPNAKIAIRIMLTTKK